MVYWHDDFELDDSSDEIADKYVLTIYQGTPGDEFGSEEVAVIVHRETQTYPLDGDVAGRKRGNAHRIVSALNDAARVSPFTVGEYVWMEWDGKPEGTVVEVVQVWPVLFTKDQYLYEVRYGGTEKTEVVTEDKLRKAT